MTILITGASGRTSSYVIQALINDTTSTTTKDIRLLVRSESSLEKARLKWPQLPPSAFVIGDYLDMSTLPPAFKGVDIVFHNGPAFHQQETAMGIAVVDAAKAAGVKHFIFCSVLFPILDDLWNHKAKRPYVFPTCHALLKFTYILHWDYRVEEYLITSGLNYTILEACIF